MSGVVQMFQGCRDTDITTTSVWVTCSGRYGLENRFKTTTEVLGLNSYGIYLVLNSHVNKTNYY